jgi:drug/metabolite transporter (DMT)-like permease
VALAVEGAPPRLGPQGAASLLYVGPIATAFAYWAVVEAGRHFPAATLSMALLATPALGILVSALWLGEPVGLGLLAGAGLVASGIRLALR